MVKPLGELAKFWLTLLMLTVKCLALAKKLVASNG